MGRRLPYDTVGGARTADLGSGGPSRARGWLTFPVVATILGSVLAGLGACCLWASTIATDPFLNCTVNSLSRTLGMATCSPTLVAAVSWEVPALLVAACAFTVLTLSLPTRFRPAAVASGAAVVGIACWQWSAYLATLSQPNVVGGSPYATSVDAVFLVILAIIAGGILQVAGSLAGWRQVRRAHGEEDRPTPISIHARASSQIRPRKD